MRKLVVGVCLVGLFGLGGYLSHRVLFPSPPKEKDDVEHKVEPPAVIPVTTTPTLPVGSDEPALRLPTGEGRNLLRLPGIRLAWATATGPERPALTLLTDNDLNSTAILSATAAAPVEVVYTLPESADGVTLEGLVVKLPERLPPGAGTGRVDVLASDLSAHAGYRLVRTDSLQQGVSAPQSFLLPPTGARHVLLRFHPARGASRVAVSEVALVGRIGLPASKYAFKESPARALDVLAGLEKISALRVPVTAEEKDLFEDAADGKLDRWSFAEAALLVSGVTDKAARKKYLARLDTLTEEARKATADDKTVWEKGDRLLRWLHTGTMSAGYQADQTYLSTILDRNAFNCVSSALLYNLLALRLGLDARAIETPTHAFSIVYEGTRHADVETTTPRGFNPARDKDAVLAFEKTTGFRYIPDLDRDRRREVRETGLLAVVYYNHAVLQGAKGKYPEALVSVFKALSLDREDVSSVKASLQLLARWGMHLQKSDRFDDALTVMKTGLALAPGDALLRHAHRALWYNQAVTLVARDRQADALEVLRRAAQAIPGDEFGTLQAWVFIHKAEGLAAAQKWAEALAATDPGAEKLDPAAVAELARYRSNLRLRHAHAELQAGRHGQAVDLLADALAREPKERRWAQYLAGAIAAQVSHTHEREGEAKALAVLKAQLSRFADVPEVKGLPGQYVWHLAQALVRKEKFTEAIVVIEHNAGLLDKEEVQQLTLAVYDAWAEHHRRRKDDRQAAQVYAEALKRRPQDRALKDRRKDTVDELARGLAERGQWEEALALLEKARADLGAELADERLLALALRWTQEAYRKGGPKAAEARAAELAKRFPRLPQLTRIARRDSLLRLLDEMVKAGKTNQALALIDRAGHLLDDPDLSRKVWFVLVAQVAGQGKGPVDAGRLPDLEARLGAGLFDPDGTVRTLAAEAIGRFGMTALVPELVRRVADPLWVTSKYINPELNDPLAGGKAAAVDALRRLAEGQVQVALEAATASDNAEVRAWATAELGRGVLTGSAAVAALVKGLKDRDFKVRERAARELARHKEPAALQALTGALNDGDGYVRRAVADALAEMGDQQTVPALMRRVADAVWFPPPKGGGLVRKEPYDGLWGLGSKDHALAALKKLAAEKVTPALLSAMRSTNRDVRLWAVDELGKHKDRVAVQDLCAALKDADSLLRRHAADALAAIGDARAADALVGRVTDDLWVPLPRGNVFYNARIDTYDGFHGIGSKDHALAAMKKLAPERITAALVTALKAPTDLMRAWAAEELGKQKDKAAVEPLCQALKDKNGRVRRCAAIALGEIGDKAAVPALVERIADEVWVPRPKGSFTYSSHHDAYDDFRDLGSKENALKALKKLAPDRVAEALQLAAKAKNEAVRQWAEKELK